MLVVILANNVARGLRSNHKGSFLLLGIGAEMKNNFEF